ncbi:beta-ketoacyl-[acyl-carrier-protein] synthase family protein [Methylocaldum sp.]|uniref:beta-ketoacyl-[acyl-carrier-protein] synthase family protein n=1 Tax=Methylocaldum sp. TaxID=1969727 RepID=UPI002D41B4FE|nr:beta-ketoacyl-[acyl-carrier-protein] synthase family protein [Methylocaldum sp.]HYE37030.1 beta-ketoacyl-[acyl-carrier-protein] synthase family protein [Methylocaldum sp.]
MQPLILSAFTLTSSLGRGLTATLAALREQRSGLRYCDFPGAELDTYIGRVEGIENEPIIDDLSDFDCRNNRLARLGLEQDGFIQAVESARRRYGPDRVAVILGTSTSGILETESAYRRRDPETGALPSDFRYRHTQNTFSVGDFTRRYLKLHGPASVVSTACSSSSKVFASAARLIQTGLCDAAVVGGVDSLCFTTLYGFTALELVSSTPCRPADADRNGISIGEAAGFALLEKPDRGTGDITLLGYGESTDAYHMSSPHPDGLGAAEAMNKAMQRAGLEPGAIDYVNLHGTATKANDAAEDKAVSGIFGATTPCSSIKGWTGHTLGAAGIVNVIVSCLSIRESFVPCSLNTGRVDPDIASWIAIEELRRPVRTVLSNAFGFGGNNASLVLGKHS